MYKLIRLQKLDTPFSKRWLKILSESGEVSFVTSKRCYYLFDINGSFINIQVISFSHVSSERMMEWFISALNQSLAC